MSSIPKSAKRAFTAALAFIQLQGPPSFSQQVVVQGVTPAPVSLPGVAPLSVRTPSIALSPAVLTLAPSLVSPLLLPAPKAAVPAAAPLADAGALGSVQRAAASLEESAPHGAQAPVLESLFSGSALRAPPAVDLSEGGASRAMLAALSSRRERPAPAPAKVETRSWLERHESLRRWSTMALMSALLFGPPILRGYGINPFPLLLGDPVLTMAWVAGLTAAKIALTVLVHALNPVLMRRTPAPDVPRWSFLQVLRSAAGAAVIEELTFRGGLFGVSYEALVTAAGVPSILAFPLSSYASSMVFAALHGYGSFWPRVAGGLFYSGMFLVSGNIAWPMMVHFLFDLAAMSAAWVRARSNTLGPRPPPGVGPKPAPGLP